MRYARVSAVLVLLAASTAVASPTDVPSKDVKLVVQVTIDALRADMVTRFSERFGADGFRRLMDRGVWYRNAHFKHSTTFTAVGHATLFTGASSAQHGIAGNDWCDESGAHVYCVGDAASAILSRTSSPEEGRSPLHLTATTIGDELILATGGRSRVFSVSFKDRGAILPGGHLGKAFWYDSKTGSFVTSRYYYETYPDWAAAWREARPADRYKSWNWELLKPAASYTYKDDRIGEQAYKHLGTTFPHALGTENEADFHAAVPYTPAADELTLDFAERLIEHEHLGQGEATDMLAVSFSATDYVHHTWGPFSVEAEDNLLRVDAVLAELFGFIDRAVGEGRVLFVLAADHGFDDIPEFRRSLGFDAGRHYPDEFIASANEALKRRFGVSENLVTAFWNPSLYLDKKAVERLKLDVAEVERALAEHMMSLPGFASAATRTDLLRGGVTDHPLMRRLQRSFHPRRSGNVLVVQSQFWYLYPQPEAHAAMHGSPYPYDTHVPVLFAGPGIGARTVHRAIGPEDIAPTIAACLGIAAPSGCIGQPLTEIAAD